MAGTVKKLQFSEGTDVGAPSDLTLATATSALEVYANDAAFVAANGTATAGDAYINSTVPSIKFYVGGAWKTAVELTAAQVITLKDIDGGTATDTSRITLSKGTTSALNALTRKEGNLFYNTTNAKAYIDNGSTLLPLALESATSQSSPFDLKNFNIAASVGSNALTIALKNSAGSDPTADDAVSIAFRSSTATSGSYTIRQVTAALSVVVSSGSTLGHTDTDQNVIYVYALDNAGTVELAVSTKLFDESQLTTTTAEGGAGAADSATTIYSTTARTSKAIRLIGKLISTQTTAGTWAAVPTVTSSGPVVYSLPNGQIRSDTGNGHGSTDTKIRRITNSTTVGTAITVSNTAGNGNTYTINERGVYSIHYCDGGSAGTAIGISVNSSQLTTAVGSITVADRLIYSDVAAGMLNTVSATVFLNAGDVVRPHTGGNNDATSDRVQFVITQVYRL